MLERRSLHRRKALLGELLRTRTYEPKLVGKQCHSDVRRAVLSILCCSVALRTAQHHVFESLEHTTALEASSERVEPSCVSGCALRRALEEGRLETASQTCTAEYQSSPCDARGNFEYIWPHIKSQSS